MSNWYNQYKIAQNNLIRPFGGPNEEVMAVIEGRKPVAIFPYQEYKTISRKLKDKVYTYIPDCDNYFQANFVIAKNKELAVQYGKEIEKLFSEYKGKSEDDKYHRDLGRILGYSNEAIEEFLRRIKQGIRSFDSQTGKRL